MVVRGTHNKSQFIEEPCEVKVSCTVLKTNGSGDRFVEFNMNGTKKSSKPYRISATDFKVIKHCWDGAGESPG
jgi:hypothetical protein